MGFTVLYTFLCHHCTRFVMANILRTNCLRVVVYQLKIYISLSQHSLCQQNSVTKLNVILVAIAIFTDNG